MHGLERIPEDTFFARGDTLRRRHSLKISKDRSKREPGRNFFSQRVVIPWNALPEKVVCSNSAGWGICDNIRKERQEKSTALSYGQGSQKLYNSNLKL